MKFKIVKWILIGIGLNLLYSACGPVKTSKVENVNAKYLALSFDDGPNWQTTPMILDVLEKHKVPASFFVNGKFVNDNTAPIMKRAVSLGCEIENHSYNHYALNDGFSAEQIREEVESTSKLVKKYVGRSPQYFRPPYIAVNELMHQTIDLPFICGVGSDDWDASKNVDYRVRGIVDVVKDGDIILLHDFTGNDPTVTALDIIITNLKTKGYTFVTVSKLFEIKDVKPEPHNSVIYTNLSK